jgi:hypothetical protein
VSDHAKALPRTAETPGGRFDIDEVRRIAYDVATVPPDQWSKDFHDTVARFLRSDEPLNKLFWSYVVQRLRRTQWPTAEYRNRTLAALKDLELQAVIAEKQRLRVETPRQRDGSPTPVEEAEAEVAKRWGHNSGPALNRWLRRNRPKTEQK